MRLLIQKFQTYLKVYWKGVLETYTHTNFTKYGNIEKGLTPF